MKEQQLIFLISQPRSGSSMLQQLLLKSNEIYSVPEPWFMLSLVYTYKKPTIEGEYNPLYTQINFNEYLNSLENGLMGFKDKIRKLALELYESKKDASKTYFLDKTPRYYHIINELYELFPKAKFIFLTRNPLAVFASILSYNFNGNLKAIFSDDRLNDLYLAPKYISDLKMEAPRNSIFVSYEDIIRYPEEELIKLYQFLELILPENIGTYNLSNEFKKSNAVDKKGLKLHDKPVKEYINSWETAIKNSQEKKVALAYINSLDNDILINLGYNKSDIISSLLKHKVKKTYFNLPLDYYTKFPNSIKYRILVKLNKMIND